MMQNDCYCDTCQNVREAQNKNASNQSGGSINKAYIDQISALEEQIKVLKELIVEMNKPAPGYFPPYAPLYRERIGVPPGNYIPWDPSTCDCSPTRGGSGICGCVMGSMNIS